LISESVPQLQLLDRVDDANSWFGLKINCSNTVVQCIGRVAHQCRIHSKLKDDILNQADDFITISNNQLCDNDMVRRVWLTAGVARNLEGHRRPKT